MLILCCIACLALGFALCLLFLKKEKETFEERILKDIYLRLRLIERFLDDILE